jgi:FdhE protein
MSEKKQFYEHALSGIRDLKDRSPDMGPLLTYYERVLEAQNGAGAAFKCDAGGLDIDSHRKRSVEKKPFFDPDDFSMDWDMFDRLFLGLSEIARQHADLDKSEDVWPVSLSGANSWHENLLKGLLVDTAALDDCADRAGIDRSSFTFLCSQAAVPFLEKHAESVIECIDVSVWDQGHCPVCGAEPIMGKLEKETGKRVLQCHQCRTEWPFKRLTCPFCGNNEQGKQRYFLDKDDKSCRVEVCDECKAYIKAVDARETEKEICLFVENIATLHLDLVAKNEGFVRDTNRLFGL